ncbi:MAG: fibronectin type III domain-containing protein [Armatimonadota bacterium]
MSAFRSAPQSRNKALLVGALLVLAALALRADVVTTTISADKTSVNRGDVVTFTATLANTSALRIAAPLFRIPPNVALSLIENSFTVDGTPVTPTIDGSGNAAVVVPALDAGQTRTVQWQAVAVGPGVPVKIYLEAESGQLEAPMTAVVDANVSGGKYITSAAANSGSAAYTITVPVSGDYVIWCRVLARSESQDSFTVAVDGGQEDMYDSGQGTWSDAWQWTRVNGRAGGAPLTLNPRVFVLSEGEHQLVFRTWDANAAIDRIIITNDMTFVPTDPSPGTPDTSDTTPPVISDVTVRNLTWNSATITWTTDEPATGQVEWGPTAAYGSTTEVDANRTTQHSATLTGLTTVTLYHFRVKSRDAAGNEAVSEDGWFRTLLSLPQGNEWFVAPDGTPEGDGTREKPWDLQTALSHPVKVKPGDKIWLRGGTYKGAFTSNLKGAPDAPIIVRQYPGERATLDGNTGTDKPTLTVGGSYVWFWGFEVMNSNPKRVMETTGYTGLPRGTGVNIFGSKIRLVNLVIHDNAGAIGSWSTSDPADSEIYGCVLYFEGWDAPDRGHGHAVYIQNQNGYKRVSDNIMFAQFSYGIHAYTEKGYLNNLAFDGNVSFCNGILSQVSGLATNILVGGYRIAQSPEVVGNFTYKGGNNVGYRAGTTGAVVRENYLVGGLAVVKATNLSLVGNTIYGGTSGIDKSEYPNNTFLASKPTGVKVVVRPNAYEPGRANIIVYNWDLNDSVQVNVSNVLRQGDRFEVRNAQDFFGSPVLRGTFDGQPLVLPMKNLTMAKPVGVERDLPVTWPEFNVFILLKTD